MAAPDHIRQFVVVRATEELRRWYEAGDETKIESLLREYLTQHRYEDKHGQLRIAGLPSREWSLQVVVKDGGDTRTIPEATQPVSTYAIPLAFASEEALHDVRAAVHNDREQTTFVGISADIRFNSTDCWCPGEAATPTFGTRKDALKLIRAEILAKEKLRGKNVNVVVIDRGLDPRHINIAKRWVFATADTTPVATPDNHAMMIARHIQKVAPEATIFDCAILPEHISDIGQFMTVAYTAYAQMLADIATWKQNGTSSTEWVFVNAWAIYNRRSEFPLGDYTNNPNHQFNLIVEQATVTHGIDQVFPAGNCGIFCPKMNCGHGDRGPGQSIFGANSHPSVLTTGAVRNDGMWLGYSSQGPGQPHLAHEKPDLCLPSQFVEADDKHLANTGTSAACGLAAAVIAALRSRPGWNSTSVPPVRLRSHLIQTARKTIDQHWNGKLGHGIMDVQAAYTALAQAYP